MSYRVLQSKGTSFEKDITKIVKGFLMFLGCGAIIVILLMAWVLFAPQPRLERVKIAMHDEQTFAKLQAKHGKAATGIVVYEEDGKAFYYKDGQKIKFQ